MRDLDIRGLGGADFGKKLGDEAVKNFIEGENAKLKKTPIFDFAKTLPPVEGGKQTYRSQDVYNNNAKTPPPPMDENDVPNGKPANVKEDFAQYEGETYIDAMTGEVYDKATNEATGNEIVYDSQGRIIDFGIGARQRAENPQE